MPFSGTTRDWLVWKGVALALVFVVLILSRPESASAHANLADADPAPNSVLETAPSKVTIWFTEPLEPSFSTIEVLNSEGSRVDIDDSAVDPNDPTVMQVSSGRTTCRTARTRSPGEPSPPSTDTRFAARSSTRSASRSRHSR